MGGWCRVALTDFRGLQGVVWCSRLADRAVTIEWQRQRAKEIRKYFQDKQQAAQAQKSQVFGWTPANEIGNGRWVMFGVFVGLLTEYATGVNFPDQIGLLLSYLGIVDVE
eukprot:gene10655-10814_t